VSIGLGRRLPGEVVSLRFVSPVEVFGMKLTRRNVARVRVILRPRFLLETESSDRCLFIGSGSVGREFFVLRLILHRRIGLENAIDELVLLLLGSRRTDESEQQRNRNELSHQAEVLELQPRL
jgi:hypothetical protein